MRFKWKRLLTATLAATTLQLSQGGNLVYSATNVEAERVSDNEIEVREDGYKENGTEKTFSGEYGFFYGGGNETNTANSYGNKLSILSGRFNGIFAGISATGNVWDNRLIINGGNISGAVGGMGIWYSGYGVGNVYNNSVIINGGTIGNVSGGEIGFSYLTSGSQPTDFSSALGNTYNNSVIVNGGYISNGIVGGSALGGNAYGNSVEINGGIISGNVIGGSTQSGNAYNNSITINGNPDLSNATLWGGRIGSNPAYTGNTLNINTWGITAKGINGFETINFNFANVGDGAALTLTNGKTNFSSGLENINVYTRGDSNIGKGSTLNLIYNASGINLGSRTLLATSADASNIAYNSTLSRGVTFDYGLTLALSADATGLTGTVSQDNPVVKEETGTTTKAQLANVVTINNGTDAMVRGFDDFLGSNIAEDDDGYFMDRADSGDDDSYSDKAQKAEDVREQHGFEIFGSANFGKLKTKTGSGGYVETESSNFDLGLARTYDSANNKWTFAPVVEHGKGNYDALLANGIKGGGDTKYTAGGLIARVINRNGYYFETSARFGRSKNDFASNDFIVNDQPIRATYHTSAPIFAGHIRVGQAKRLNRSNLLDIYGIYAYTRQGGSDTTLSTGEDYKFSSVTSSRFRLGYRLTTRTSRISRIYTGIAWQYENTSDVTTRAFDAEGFAWELPTSGSKGSSGMLEFGWLIKPRQDNPWLVDINATGWIGHQKGATAMAKIKKSF